MNHTCTLFVVSIYFCSYNWRVDLQVEYNLNDMKLSKLTYHNGAIKIEVYQKGQDRKRWNTGVRVDKKLLTKDKFIKPTTLIDWQTLNIKISEEKERVDRVVREVFKELKYIDVIKVFDILGSHQQEIKLAIEANRSRSMLKNGLVKKRLGGAIKTLHNNFELSRIKEGNTAKFGTGESQSPEHINKREIIRREKFLNELNLYLLKESQVTSQTTIARYFVEYLSEGTTIGFTNLRRHYRIFEFMINNPIIVEDINDNWIRSLMDWLECGVRGRGVNSNTSDWLFGRFQCFWTWALNNNIVTKRIHWKRFKRITFKPGFVWLTEERIIQLAKAKFQSQRLEYTRMAYLVLTLTGLRHSDFHSLHPSDLVFEDSKWYIHKSNKKTKTVFKTEVHDLILDWIKDEVILSKIKFSIDSNRSNNTLNVNIRDMGEAFGWKEPVRLQVDSDKWEVKSFFEWMNCHSGRHSAVCLWLSHGVNYITIKKWTGWKGGSKMIEYYADILNIKTKESINALVKL